MFWLGRLLPPIDKNPADCWICKIPCAKRLALLVLILIVGLKPLSGGTHPCRQKRRRGRTPEADSTDFNRRTPKKPIPPSRASAAIFNFNIVYAAYFGAQFIKQQGCNVPLSVQRNHIVAAAVIISHKDFRPVVFAFLRAKIFVKALTSAVSEQHTRSDDVLFCIKSSQL